MIVRPYQDIGPEEWDDHCLKSPYAWFFHTSRWLEYQEARGYDNLSFGLVDETGVVAVCPLMVDGVHFMFEGYPGPWPTHADEMQAAVVSDRILQLAKSRRILSAMFRSCPLTSDPFPLLNYMHTLGWTSHLLELQHNASLKKGLRKSYKSIINKGLRELAITQEPDGVLTSRMVHMEASGRATRTEKTWSMMHDWTLTGHGLNLVARRDTKPVGFAYFILYKSTAYYGMAGAIEPNVGHTLLWMGISELRDRGFEMLEIGWQGQAPDEKGKQIEFFKSGFPGDDVPVMVAERRFYD